MRLSHLGVRATRNARFDLGSDLLDYLIEFENPAHFRLDYPCFR
jgi:hypothetical protein